MRAPLRALSPLFAALSLASCASLPVPGASSEAEVIAHFGKPQDARQLADGAKQLYYPRGPLGRETWRATIAADGRLQSLEQLLDEPHFARLKAGMSRDDVERELGRHFINFEFSNLDELVWSWRYTEVGSRYMFFNAHFDSRTGLLKYTSRNDEFPPPRGRR